MRILFVFVFLSSVAFGQSKKKQIDKDDMEFVKQNVKELKNSDLKNSLLNLGNKITTEDK